MKKYLSSIILGIIIVILVIAVTCLYFNDKKETTTNNPVETTEPVETATPEPTPPTEPTPTTEPAPEDSNYVDINYADIDPEIHSTMSDDKVEVDETLLNTMMTKCPYFTGKRLNEEEVKQVLEVFLKYYYNGIVDKDEWLQFATTGDKKSFWVEFTDEDILFVHDTEMAAWERWKNTEEGQEAMKNDPNYELYLKSLEELEKVQAELDKLLAEEEARQNSPYMSDRHGYNVGDTTILDNGLILAYQGEDIWKDISSDTKYKTTKELENGGLWFEPINTQQASGNPDSPYISDRYGHNIGDQMVIYDYKNVTYQGEDIWIDENSRVYTVVKDHGNGYMEFAQGLFAKPGETPVSERVGYQPGDTIFCQSLGYSFNRVYVGNDIWYNDNEPDVELIASLQNGELGFTRYTWK